MPGQAGGMSGRDLASVLTGSGWQVAAASKTWVQLESPGEPHATVTIPLDPGQPDYGPQLEAVKEEIERMGLTALGAFASPKVTPS